MTERLAGTAKSAPPVNGWPSRGRAGWALFVLLLAYMLSFVDRITLSILIRPVSAELGMSDMQFALVGGVAFSVFYVAAGLPIGWLVDRYSRRTIIVGGILIWSLATIFTAMSDSFGWLFASRVMVGVGEAALSPAAYSLIADLFPPQTRGRAVAVYTLGVSLGSSLAYFVGGQLIGFASTGDTLSLPLFGELAPWRYVFVLVGLPGVLLAALMLTVKEPTRVGTAGRAEDEATGPRAFWRFLKRHRAISCCYIFGYSAINLPFAGFMLWGPALFERVHGLGPAQISIPLALIFLGPTIAGQWVGASVSDRLLARGRRDAPFQTGAVCAALMVPVAIAMPLVSDANAAFILLAAIVFLVCASVGHHAVVAAMVAPNRLRGLYVAGFFFIQNILGQAVVSLVTAFLTDCVFGTPAALGKSMAIVGGAGGIGGVALLLTGRRHLRWAQEAPALQIPA